MSDTKRPEVIQWLRSEAGRAATERAKKNDDGAWENSARRRSTLWKRSYMLNRAADLLKQKEHSDYGKTACIWEDCDQGASYCEGHAHELVNPLGPDVERAALLQLVEDIRGAWQGYCDNPPITQGFENHRIFYKISDVLNGICCVCGERPCNGNHSNEQADEIERLRADIEDLGRVNMAQSQRIAELEALLKHGRRPGKSNLPYIQRIAELESNQQANARKQWDAACAVYQDRIASLEDEIALTKELHAAILDLIGSEGMTDAKFVRWVETALAKEQNDRLSGERDQSVEGRDALNNDSALPAPDSKAKEQDDIAVGPNATGANAFQEDET